MSEEVKKIEYFYSKQVSTASMKYSSLTLLNLFESLVKCLTHHYYVYEPQAALPLITHILAILQQKVKQILSIFMILVVNSFIFFGGENYRFQQIQKILSLYAMKRI
jgi:hypothetical protein